MTTTQLTTARIIRKLILGEDYRSEVVALIDAAFLEYAIDFFKHVVEAKLRHHSIDVDWYRQAMLSPELGKEDIATHAGINIKTVQNMVGTTRKEAVIQVSEAHYDALLKILEDLTGNSDELNLKLTIKFRDVSVDLSITESLVVINALAVKRAALRGGLWSTAGKQVEKPLMTTLCELHHVPKEHYEQASQAEQTARKGREVDFYLIGGDGKRYRCEVKLMGRGNPESADAAFARDSDVFVADTLSDSVKQNLDGRGILWVEMRGADGVRQFQDVLGKLRIPFTPIDPAELPSALDEVLGRLIAGDSLSSVNMFSVREDAEEYQAEG
ncbi:MAG: CfrBI family restriction endonuclease [Armatimonadota bacterium]